MANRLQIDTTCCPNKEMAYKKTLAVLKLILSSILSGQEVRDEGGGGGKFSDDSIHKAWLIGLGFDWTVLDILCGSCPLCGIVVGLGSQSLF